MIWICRNLVKISFSCIKGHALISPVLIALQPLRTLIKTSVSNMNILRFVFLNRGITPSDSGLSSGPDDSSRFAINDYAAGTWRMWYMDMDHLLLIKGLHVSVSYNFLSLHCNSESFGNIYVNEISVWGI